MFITLLHGYISDTGCHVYFCRCDHDHICQMIFNSDNWFQEMFSFSHSYIRETGHAPWWPCFLTDKIILAFFVEGHPVIISTKSF